MLDRININIEDPCEDYEKLSSDRMGVSSASIRERVRFEDSAIVYDSDVLVAEMRQLLCGLA